VTTAVTAVSDSKVLEAARGLIAREVSGLQAVSEQLDENFLRVVDLFLNLPGKVFITGSGTSGIIGRRMAHLLTVCGTPALYLQPMDALHGAMGVVAKGDVLVAISRGGGSAEINDLIKCLRDIGLSTVVALTNNPDSELARLADFNVVWKNPTGIDPGEVVAMGSTLAVGAWGDALAYVLMILREHSWQQVLHNHPAGAVGTVSEPPPALTLTGGQA
jgi:D-arabinose 5-phosphate isomerase GutQ